MQVSKKNVSKELAQKIHDKAAPFIKWLQEAEEETSESDGCSIYFAHVFFIQIGANYRNQVTWKLNMMSAQRSPS